MPAAQPSEARIKAALAAAKAQGLRVGELRIEPDGTLRIIADTAEPRQLASGEVVDCNALFGRRSG